MSYLRHYTLDDALEMKDAGLVASSAAATVGGNAKVIDTGGGEYEGDVLIDVSAIEIASNDEAYTIVVQGSPDAAFTAATSVELCHLHLGAAETKLTDTNQDDTTGRYVLKVQNTYAGTVYRYLRLYTVVAGTIATGINYTAWMCKSK